MRWVFSRSSETVDMIHTAQITKSTGDRTARIKLANNKMSIATAQAQLFATCRQTTGNKCPENIMRFSPKNERFVGRRILPTHNYYSTVT